MPNGERDLTGFTEVTDTTGADGIDYPIPYLQVDSEASVEDQFDVVTEALGGREGIISTFNADQKQGATQGAKGAVRKAIRAAREAGHSDDDIQDMVDSVFVRGEDAPEDEALAGVVEAITAHRENAATYIKGPGRRATGMTKTAARRAGEALAEVSEDALLKALIAEYGEERARAILEGKNS